jgi:NAD(P)H dehydrogenase (quinone)
MAPCILVTGATGTVGRSVLQQLLPDHMAGRIKLKGTARSEANVSALTAIGVPSVSFDFDHPKTLRSALSGVDTVFLATGYSVDMLAHSKRLLDAARAERVGHIVHLGALAADDSPHAHFAWHRMIEHSIEAMGFSYTHLRPNFFIETVWKGFCYRPDRLIHFVANRNVSWISAEDIASVAAQALRAPEAHSGQVYPLAAERLSFPNLASLLTEVTGQSVNYVPRPAADLLPILLKQGMEPNYAAGLAEGMEALELGKMPDCDAVYDNISTLIGRPPVLWRDYAMAHLSELRINSS